MVNRQFRTGFLDGLPFLLVAVPFAILFGVAATEAGLSLIQTMSMTTLVIAGAAQFTALVLLQENAPTLIVIATALAVNLRMAMYAAAMAPYLGGASRGRQLLLAYFNIDQTFALSSVRFPREPDWTLTDRFAYFCGAGSALMPFWIAFSYVGAVTGSAIPPEASLDFALPICFIAIIGPMLRTIPHVVAALVSVAATLALAWVPFSLGLILAAILAMICGAATERWMETRA